MIQTLNHYSSTAKTAEIMSRYRPIAPKPELSLSPSSDDHQSDHNSSSPSSSSSVIMSQKIRDSPYLRSVWPHLQARPTRTRKRGRTSMGPPPPPPSSTMLKRPRTTTTHLLTLSPYSGLDLSHFHESPSQAQAQAHVYTNLVTLPLLSCPHSIPILTHHQQAPTFEADGTENGVIDLNVAAEVPEERDFLKSLMGPTTAATIVIAPQPVRPIGSSIRIGPISEDSKKFDPGTRSVPKKKKKRAEVEEEVEAEALPAVVSDSKNKVRMANAAYKEMVGQPEYSWLDCMGSCKKRISGEVMLRFSEEEAAGAGSGLPVNSGSSGFSCWVRIEWGSNGKEKSSIKAFSEVTRLSCESNDYLFAWRFHIARDSSASAFRLNV